ncbi:nudC domain-containing protein 1-like [Anneissia japonica]|uniref:nudC domain-containing protein 1-like n=1 Tax=Anneissia japonica TaxID=1529436 RepID=UPI001425676B|nr:nudC domain-containing protein 1-like [Anneissia japonica]
MAGLTESLNVDRTLLDPNFDGYKLSLDPLPSYSVKTDSGIDSVRLRDDQYSYQHVKAFGLHNHLFLDVWHMNSVYYVDEKWHVRRLRVILESQLDQPSIVFTIPDFDQKRHVPRHNVSITFPSETMCVLADGTGTLFVLDTGQRDTPELSKWKVLYSDSVCEDDQAFLLLDSVLHFEENSEPVYECLLLYIREKETFGASKNDGFEVILEWVTLFETAEDASIKVQGRRKFSGASAPWMAAIDRTGTALLWACETDFTVVQNTFKPLASNGHTEEKEEEEEVPLYTWTQTQEDTIVTFTIPQDSTKEELNIRLTHDHIEISIKGDIVLLKGELPRFIDVETSSWTVENKKLELMLAKQDVGTMWSEVVIGDSRGRYIVDPDQARIIHEKLAHLTSEELDASPHPGGFKPGVTPQELEDCDICPEGDASMARFDGNKNEVTNKVSLGSHQWLFNATLDPKQMPCICLRHDVDGIVWQPTTPDEQQLNAWKHHATFNALGYVQAAKTSKKFASCSQDTSYAVLCDCIRHLYIYRQPSPTLSPLRNRKSGRVIGELAKQQVISLDTTDDILGMQATNERLFVLTSKKLYVVKVRLENS